LKEKVREKTCPYAKRVGDVTQTVKKKKERNFTHRKRVVEITF